MTETQFKQRVIEVIRQEYKGVWFKKISDRFQSGIPDILGCFPGPEGKGRFFAIELKIPGGRVAPLQDHEIDKIKKAGGAATVAYTIDQVREFLNNVRSTA